MKKYIFPFIILFLIISAIFLPVLVTAQTFFARDLTYLYHPWRTFAAESIQAGRVPLWNPYVFCGMPFMANMQTAVWYPFNVIFYIFPFVISLKIYHIVHYVIGGFFGFLLARKYNLSVAGSLIAAILFALNGYLITKLEFLNELGVAIWLPVLLIFRRNYILLGISFALSYLAGFPQLLLFQILAYIIFISLERRLLAYDIGILLLGGICGIVLSGIQFFPACELFSNSMRGVQGFPVSVAGSYSLKLKDYIGLIMPYFVGERAGQITGEKIFWPIAMYIGITGGAVISIGFLKLKLIKKIYCAILVLIIVLISLGTNTFLFNYLYEYVPIIKLFRYPSRILYVLIAIILFLSIRFGSKYKPYHLLLIIPLIIELYVLNYKLYPIINADYFHYKGGTVSFLQKYSKKYRYLISPRSQLEQGVYSFDVASAWYWMREYLYGNIGLPYHLYNATGMESLALENQKEIINNILSAENLEIALKMARNAHVKYIICTYNVEKKFNPVILNNRVNIIENNYINEDNQIKTIYYPGWKAYVQGKEIELYKDVSGWMGISPAPARRGRVHYLYRPLTYRIGLILSMLAILYLCFYGLYLVHKQ